MGGAAIRCDGNYPTTPPYDCLHIAVAEPGDATRSACAPLFQGIILASLERLSCCLPGMGQRRS